MIVALIDVVRRFIDFEVVSRVIESGTHVTRFLAESKGGKLEQIAF